VRPSQRTIRRRLKELRRLIDTSPCPAEQRVAYGMETAIRWVTEDTTGWDSPAVEATKLAQILREELP
jgi:hypothetical protein